MAELKEVPMQRGKRSHFALAMLLVIYLFSLVDRQILSVLIEPIRLELGFSDLQMGMLSGLAFGLLYAIAGLPLARIADRSSRRRLIGLCLFGWSVATGLCGVAQNFVQMFLARVGVGIGEAGASPASQSMITDMYPPQRRATALGIYSMGVFVGSGLGLALGGALAQSLGWRGAFVAVAIPGALFSLLFMATVPEPPRAGAGGAPEEMDGEGFVSAAMQFVRSGARFHAALGFGFSVLTVQALLNWLPALFARYDGLSVALIGARLGPTVAVSGTVGVLLGGVIADTLNRRDPRNGARMMAMASLLVVPASAFALFGSGSAIVLSGVAATFLLTAAVAGPTLALNQNLAPPGQRAFSAALIALTAVLLGNAFGPFLAGLLSDLYGAAGLVEPLRWSLMTCTCLSGVGALFYLLAARGMTSD